MKARPDSNQICVLDNIPIKLDADQAVMALHWNRKRDPESELRKLLDQAEALIQPKAAYRVSAVGWVSEDEVAVGGVTFSSRVLRINLAKVESAFPYIVTIGKCLETEAQSSGDLLKQYYLETLGDLALHLAEEYLAKTIKTEYRLRHLFSMNPGSLKNWPLTQQKMLFALFGNTEGLLGVRLTDQMLMIPRKSISGIYIPSAAKFSSCKLCQRKNCQGRKADYDARLSRSYRLEGEPDSPDRSCEF
jgi:hypothetical protein